ncbi:MAG: hypothetical protein ACYC7G_06280 [Rudaea sp.]
MPQLPSGRHVAIQAAPLFSLMEDSMRAGAIITRLLRIERVEHLYPYIDVMFFIELDGARTEGAPGGQPIPEGLQPFPSGFTLASIGAERATWPQTDRAAFATYLASDRVRAHLVALFNEVERLKQRLADEGDAETRLQVLWWKQNCHPVQGAETEDPTFDLLEDPYDPNARR